MFPYRRNTPGKTHIYEGELDFPTKNGCSWFIPEETEGTGAVGSPEMKPKLFPEAESQFFLTGQMLLAGATFMRGNLGFPPEMIIPGLSKCLFFIYGYLFLKEFKKQEQLAAPSLRLFPEAESQFFPTGGMLLAGATFVRKFGFPHQKCFFLIYQNGYSWFMDGFS